MSTPSPSRSGPRVLAAVLAVVALVAGAVLLFRGGSDDRAGTSTSPSPSGAASAGATSATPSSGTTADPSGTATPAATDTPGGGASDDPDGGAGPTASPRGASTPPTSPGAERPTTKPFAIDEPGRTGSGSTVRVLRTRGVQGQARLPGEIGGPSIAVDIEVTSADRLDLATTVVSLYYGRARTPAIPLTAGTRPLQGTLSSGRSATGTYVFRVPPDQRSRVVVTCDLRVSEPVVVFRGSVR